MKSPPLVNPILFVYFVYESGKNSLDSINQAKPCLSKKELSDNLFELESYSITKEQFDSMKNKSAEYYSLALTQKEFEELSRDEILKKRIEYLKENNLL
mgnify:CR=1 FL=1|jgi:hypothetical protein